METQNSIEENPLTSRITDELTGICNRTGFYKYTRELLDQHQETQFCILYWNIRRFKVVNNLFGWATGDKILVQLADSMRKEFQGSIATYGRLERDNFVCCVPLEYITQGKWMRLGDISYRMGDLNYHFSCCYGIYEIEDRSLSVSEMGDKARMAMETVKDNYMCSYAWYTEEMWSSIVEEQQLSSDFKEAIAQKQFKVYYQPICNGENGQVTGAEALVRWKHPLRGLISPGVFIPLFERNGYISILDRYVWNEVCIMQRRRLDKGLKALPVSINVSRVEFYNQHLCEDIRNIVVANNIPTELIKIEITETAYADNPRQVQEAVDKLHEYGFVVLMDDFGSGYSSLNILKDLPIDILKIDMKFLDDFATSKKAGIILEAIVRMAKWMQLRVVAEGVEDRKEWDVLKSMECDFVQGYYFYKPMPEDDYEHILDTDAAAEKLFSEEEYDDLENTIKRVFQHGNDQESAMFYGMIGGMGIMEMSGDSLEILQVNKGYYEVMYSSDRDLRRGDGVLNKSIVGEDYTALLGQCRASKEKNSIQQLQLHHLREDDTYIWLNVKIKYLGSSGKRSLFYFAIDNIDEMKKMESEKYIYNYSAALLKVFDKVYRLDYSDGTVEVLHTAGKDKMQVGEKYQFLNFFVRYADDIEWINSEGASRIVTNKELMDQRLQESRNGSYSVSYRIRLNDDKQQVREINVLFFKVEPRDGEEEYLCCIKSI